MTIYKLDRLDQSTNKADVQNVYRITQLLNKYGEVTTNYSIKPKVETTEEEKLLDLDDSNTEYIISLT